MSFSINFTVTDGVPAITSATTGEAAPPDGSYTVGGHVRTPGTAGPSISLSTPIGYASASMHPRAFQTEDSE